jgi:hypothetical protein
MGKMIGNGATLSFGSAIAGIQSMDGPEWSGEDVDVSDLGSSSFMEFLYSGLADGGEVSADIFMDPTVTPPAPDGVVQSITITQTDGTSTRTIAGSGYCRSVNYGGASVGEAIVGNIVLKFDGIGTAPNISTAP